MRIPRKLRNITGIEIHLPTSMLIQSHATVAFLRVLDTYVIMYLQHRSVNSTARTLTLTSVRKDSLLSCNLTLQV